MPRRVAIVGGGPSALFLLRRLTEQHVTSASIDIFESAPVAGCGFPYSAKGAGWEHVTNVSGNEIPSLAEPLADWVASANRTGDYNQHFNSNDFSDYSVVPRLLFGDYLATQFDCYLAAARASGISVTVHLQTLVTDITDVDPENKMTVTTNAGDSMQFDIVIICTGHTWSTAEKKNDNHGYHFDSPYPPAKLNGLINMPVDIKGSSLTAVDAVRTIARLNGRFSRDQQGTLSFLPDPAYPDFQLNMRSLQSLLPGMRFHLEDSHLAEDNLLSREDIDRHRRENGGFVSLDFLFEENFKKQFAKKDAAFFRQIEDWKMEDFIGAAVSSFASDDPFELFAQEYADSLRSIKERKSEYWKEKLAILSVAMNYPAKYLSAEDTTRLYENLLPLISVVIAFVPQQSAEELLAVHRAGKLFLTRSEKGQPDPENGATAFVNCTGQPRLWIKDFPFRKLVTSGAVSQATVRYRTQKKTMDVPGLAITDRFRTVTKAGLPHAGLFIMAVPFIGGFNPDYSGLDFCEDAAEAIVDDLAELFTKA